jgi:hypothetical protein
MLQDTWRQFDRVAKHIETLEPGTDEYDRALKELREIVDLQERIYLRPDFKSRFDWFLNNSALIGAAASLLTTVLMLRYANDPE